MALRVARWSLVSLVTLPLLAGNCGGGDDRTFVETDGSSGTGGGAGAGASGGTAGSAGSATGGSAGSTGGSGNASGSSGTGGAPDGGTPCTDATQCDDGNPCNGDETCTANYCASGTPPGDGTACTPNFGDAGPPDGGGGEFVCASGVCSLKCASDADCEDNDLCSGKEICHPTSKTCLSGTPLACDDSDVCTDNQCDPVTGCFYPLIDADSDGHAATSLGSCGDDCNDSDPAIYTGAGEACDNKDNNCNGQTDETAPTWYVDCDGDAFAPTGAPGVQQCQKPASPHASCNGTGGWTLTAPGVGTADCWDKDPKAHPMTATQNNTAWQTVPMSGSPPVSIDYDYNCDGTEELAPAGKTGVSTSSSCTYATGASCYQILPIGAGGSSGFEPAAAGGSGGIGGIGGITCCLGSDGWTGAAPTTCGGSAYYTECDFTGATTCGRTNSYQKRACR